MSRQKWFIRFKWGRTGKWHISFDRDITFCGLKRNPDEVMEYLEYDAARQYSLCLRCARVDKVQI